MVRSSPEKGVHRNLAGALAWDSEEEEHERRSKRRDWWSSLVAAREKGETEKKGGAAGGVAGCRRSEFESANKAARRKPKGKGSDSCQKASLRGPDTTSRNRRQKVHLTKGGRKVNTERLALVGVKKKRLKKELHSKNGKAGCESSNTIVLEAKAHTITFFLYK
ncbi:hypothetical protein K7X08_033205 [Anisodus acutangulus]|uniref:Uncharacterized protein n=1 Tax=Anisodus acutangulus TaxID=402998 RepID=A0A9Q1RCC5_9SOLA|nr:hypothetical protein K7X08_033205 [Anisodus acutangulus]